MMDLRTLLLTKDIFPLGDFEAIPVKLKRDGEATSYAPVVRLGSCEFIEEMLTEAKQYINYIGRKFVRERIDILPKEVPLERIFQTLADVGFTKETYQSYSLRKLGTNELENFVTGRTREFFAKFPVACFRMQYGVAQPAWTSIFHRDHENFRTHGFRAMAPLGQSVIISFIENERESVYELRPGSIYFVNIARLHRGYNPFANERINLIMQMSADSLIVNGSPETPIAQEEVERRFGPYATTRIMELWK